MRIAQVAPLAEAVPPRAYGGTERVVSWLTEELVRRGHEVTLFASGDSVTSARLVASVDEGLRLAGKLDTFPIEQMLQIDAVTCRAREFDVIHYHCDYYHFPLSRRISTPTLTTLHGRLDLPGLTRAFGAYPEMPLVSISDAQRQPLDVELNWWATVHHGLPKDLLAFNRDGGKYFAFLGRISQEKRLDRAIAIARALDTPLKVAAKVDPMDQKYFETTIEPLLGDPLVEMVGEIGDADKGDFLGNAKALLFPIDWPEPFGLVMIEALACGTPVVAFRNGSVPEVLVHGETGFIVDTLEEAIAAAGQVESIDRARCRAHFERCFSVETMAKNYEQAYERLLERSTAPASRRASSTRSHQRRSNLIAQELSALMNSPIPSR
ncbi:MAG TPA: glycosyltransferase family 4 protein [Polyangiaceae bacterium]|nr:glycosyltransferase family 4 protein [Polyangiaceae bacterium]